MGTVYLHWPYYTMLLILVSILSSSAVMARTPNTKAASTRVNCGCQCSSLTFRDKYNRIQGNCKTSDNTGAQWCYTEPGSTCEDLQRSTRFGAQGRTWSYQACSTPSIHSSQCSGFGGFGGNNGGFGGNSGGFGGFNGNSVGFGGNNGGFGGHNSGLSSNNAGFNGNNGGSSGHNGGFGGNNGGFNGNNGEFSGHTGGFSGNNAGVIGNNGGSNGSGGLLASLLGSNGGQSGSSGGFGGHSSSSGGYGSRRRTSRQG